MSKVYTLNIREQRLKERQEKENCCGGNGPNCKCSTPQPKKPVIEPNPHRDHFNEIFNSGFNRR
jgi:hypothetical protein